MKKDINIEENKMQNLRNLIKDLENQAKSKWAIKEDMADMYNQDARDTEILLHAILAEKIDLVITSLSKMDTLPRDNAVLAIIEDKGNEWAYNNIGWSAK